ncbi:hypothetical protein MUG84_12685 [Paenibacillus sp. KQZ6P-2]|uniref:Preprotein translocase subunit Tim44 n=1 Tax=Paenibacillus mangrovi TaxID=2931978 RepID=A0A9X2B6C1_9BACL|nr:hypothetical protein [Paenibacillus mangrovi]MCJ8012588.1 hypothetical protein [Paenibacillus mangrovi]
MMTKTMKKWTMIIMAFTIFFAISLPADSVDAKRSSGGSYRSGSKGFTNTPKKSPTTDNVKKSTNTNNSTSGTTAKRGFFSGGGFMKGLMMGGIAGMLFGGLFSNMGFFGNILGLLINLLAIYVVVSLVIAGVRAFKNRRKPDTRDGRY